MNMQYSLQARLWQEVFVFAIALTGIVSILVWPLGARGMGTFVLTVLAICSGIFLAMSFSLSSFAYYFNFLDNKVVYRKQLGLFGYFFALGYALITAYMKPEIYILAFPQNLFTIEVGLGFLAMAIFTLMACISNAKAAQILGGKLWKGILGLGYIAYALLVIRGILLDSMQWQHVLLGLNWQITPRMGLTILGIVVLCFRVSVPFHKYYKKNNYV